jgi:hypothetical protein
MQPDFNYATTLRRTAVGALMALLLGATAAAATPAGIAVVHSAEWSPGDTVREGAGEFEVLLKVAQLQHSHTAAGLVCVGDHNGILRSGGERALRVAALTGVPVAKLAHGGEVAPDPDALFLDAHKLNEADAARVLKHCLEQYGPPPASANPSHPTARELAAIRAHLLPFQAAFALAAGPVVAVR